jgi:hypothetical protein
MSRADYTSVGSCLLGFAPKAGVSITYRITSRESVTFSSAPGLARPAVDWKFNLPFGGLEFTAAPTSETPFKFILSPDLSRFNSTLVFEPLNNGSFRLSTRLPIAKISPAIIYSSAKANPELAISPECYIGGAKLLGNLIYEFRHSPTGYLSLALRSLTLRTDFGKDGVLDAGAFESIGKLGPLKRVSIGLTGKFTKGEGFQAASVLAKFQLKKYLLSAIVGSQIATLRDYTLEVRIEKARKVPRAAQAALLVKTSPLKPLELSIAGIVPWRKSGRRISYKASLDGSAALSVALPACPKTGIAVTLSALFADLTRGREGMKPALGFQFVVDPKPTPD